MKFDLPNLIFISIRVQAIIVGTGGHFLIRLGSQNEWDGQRDRGPEDGTIVKGLSSCIFRLGWTCSVSWCNGNGHALFAGRYGVRDPVDAFFCF